MHQGFSAVSGGRPPLATDHRLHAGKPSACDRPRARELGDKSGAFAGPPEKTHNFKGRR
jgi:hypothetical protein